MRKPDHDRRVVVTGLGVISPVGNDVPTAWDNLVRGVVRPRRADPVRRLAATSTRRAARSATSTPPTGWTRRPPAAARASMHFGVAAAKQALADSGFEITDANREEVGVVFGSGAGGQQLMIDSLDRRSTRRARGRVPPTFIANALVDSTSGMIAIETGAIGHNICSRVGLRHGHPQRRARRAEAIRRGDCIAVISGSTEAPLLEVGPRRLHEHARDGLPAAGRAAPDRLAGRSTDPQRVRPRRGRGRRCSSRTSSWRRRAARRSTPRSSATARRPTAGT